MKLTDNVTFEIHLIFIPLNQLFRAILNFGLQIAVLLYRFSLSFFTKLIRRMRALNPNSKIYEEQKWGLFIKLTM